MADNAYKPKGITPLRMLGRCANGCESDSGRNVHAKPHGSFKALCGKQPGRTSTGWSVYPSSEVTCPQCLRKLQKHAAVLAAAKELEATDGQR